MFAEIIKNLSAHFNRHRDRVGLISISGQQAEILNHPSRNHRVTAKSMMQLSIKGATPLGDGLVKALEMVKIEKTKNPGSKPVIILLSDCFPEPITHRYDDIMDEPMYRHALSASEMIRRRGVSLIIINPSYRSESYLQAAGASFRRTPGERLTNRMIQRSGGLLIPLKTRMHHSHKSATTKIIGQEKQIHDILASIESVFTGQRDNRNSMGLQGV